MAKELKVTELKVRIANCGSNLAYGEYGTLRDTNAMKLLERVMVTIGKTFVDEKDLPELLANTCFSILNMVKIKEDLDLKELIKDYEKYYKNWELVK